MHFCSRVHVHRLLQIFCSSRASSFLFLDFWKRKNSKRAREESEIYQGVGTWNAAIPNPKRRERVGGCRGFLCSDGGRDLCESILYHELYLKWIMKIILQTIVYIQSLATILIFYSTFVYSRSKWTQEIIYCKNYLFLFQQMNILYFCYWQK